MEKFNYKYEFLKTYRSIQTFMGGERLARVKKVVDDDLGMCFIWSYYYPNRRSKVPRRTTAYTIIIATTAHNVDIEDLRVSLVRHSNTRVYPDAFWLAHL